MIDASPGNASTITDRLADLTRAYYRILLVVGPTQSGKTSLLKTVSQKEGLPLVNLGLELSRRLLNLTIRQRRLAAADLIDDILEDSQDTAVAVDNTEIIFEPALKLNPLGLLQAVSRRRSLVWSCPGRLDADHLVYAYPGHPEHYRIPVGEFQIVEL